MSDDLIHWLQTLMRAERAGARVMLDSLRQTDEPIVRQRLERLHEGEAESCRRLRRCLEHLGAKPDGGVGDFHASAMAIEDLELRFDFIGRGQRWVARQITQRLPEIDEPWLREELEAVLRLHQ
ncbi:MAG: dioxygenase [Pseudomonas sp.]|uniref:DUF892 family protein n=1 Tax=Pseudomonas sp. TaxID=306 RepID=UPI000CB7AE35|nr:DUF892 family protein [Pseudomonas sp.]PJI50397.1 MAG: dioxygenase [Pseudomonas sp.]